MVVAVAIVVVVVVGGGGGGGGIPKNGEWEIGRRTKTGIGMIDVED